jgi:hypothetical protein
MNRIPRPLCSLITAVLLLAVLGCPRENGESIPAAKAPGAPTPTAEALGAPVFPGADYLPKQSGLRQQTVYPGEGSERKEWREAHAFATREPFTVVRDYYRQALGRDPDAEQTVLSRPVCHWKLAEPDPESMHLGAVLVVQEIRPEQAAEFGKGNTTAILFNRPAEPPKE